MIKSFPIPAFIYLVVYFLYLVIGCNHRLTEAMLLKFVRNDNFVGKKFPFKPGLDEKFSAGLNKIVYKKHQHLVLVSAPDLKLKIEVLKYRDQFIKIPHTKKRKIPC